LVGPGVGWLHHLGPGGSITLGDIYIYIYIYSMSNISALL
jgi:hypothetical protein